MFVIPNVFHENLYVILYVFFLLLNLLVIERLFVKVNLNVYTVVLILVDLKIIYHDDLIFLWYLEYLTLDVTVLLYEVYIENFIIYYDMFINLQDL